MTIGDYTRVAIKEIRSFNVAIRRVFGLLYIVLEHTRNEMTNPPPTRHRKQPQLSVAHLAAQELHHRLRVLAVDPLRFSHVAPSRSKAGQRSTRRCIMCR